MGEQQHPGSGGPPPAAAVPPTVPGAQDGGISSAWESGTAADAALHAPMPAPTPDGEAGQEDITTVRAKISALQREIDRLTALIETAARKLED
jgi:hypothetical protein